MRIGYLSIDAAGRSGAGNPLTNQKVRQAIWHAINRQDMADKLVQGGSRVPPAPCFPTQFGCDADAAVKYPFDPAKAKALLAEAGYGPGKPLTFELLTNNEKAVFNVITTVIKEQLARIGVTANIKLVDKVSWLNTATQDGPFDMYVEDLASLMVVDQNAYLAASTAAWNSARHTDTKVDEYFARYAREMDPAKRKAIAKEFQEFSVDKLYWNTISGSPFYQVAQPWMKGYTYQAEFKVIYKKVWLDK
jgi:peptide/nickel transport system substrate-binding protein